MRSIKIAIKVLDECGLQQIHFLRHRTILAMGFYIALCCFTLFAFVKSQKILETKTTFKSLRCCEDMVERLENDQLCQRQEIINRNIKIEEYQNIILEKDKSIKELHQQLENKNTKIEELEGMIKELTNKDKQDCGDPPTKSGATMKEGSNCIGSTRQYTCLDDHRTEGSTTITCQTNGQWTSTNLTCRPITWPLGTYGLYKGKSGCPVDGSWKEGNRQHYTDSDRPATEWHADIPTFMSGSFSKYFLRYDFCIRDSNNVTSFDQPWQPGSYCLLKKFTCPTGFAAGWIYMDDEDTNNRNSFNGTLPDGVFDTNTRFDYCCRSDGSASNPIYLPTHTSFYLLRKGGSCQRVATMRYQEHWIFFDGEDVNHSTRTQGEIPDSESSRTNNWKIWFCRYSK